MDQVMPWVSCTSSVVSIAVGVLAIWLSVRFYTLSTSLHSDSLEAAKDISNSVERLNDLFDKLLGRTLGMVEKGWDAYTKGIPSGGSALPVSPSGDDAQLAESVFDRVRKEIQPQIEELQSSATARDGDLARVTEIIDDTIRKSVATTKTAAREEAVPAVLNALEQVEGPSITAGDLYEILDPSVSIREMSRALRIIEGSGKDPIHSSDAKRETMMPDDRILIRHSAHRSHAQE